MNNRNLSSQAAVRGISLLELLLCLTLIAVILIGIGGYYTATNNARLTSEAYNDLQVIGNACQSWWEDKGHSFDGIDMDALVKAGYLNDSYKSAPWSAGQVLISKQNPQLVQITFSNVPWKVCNSLMLRVLGAASAGACTRDSPSGSASFTVCMDGNQKYAICSSPS